MPSNVISLLEVQTALGSDATGGKRPRQPIGKAVPGLAAKDIRTLISAIDATPNTETDRNKLVAHVGAMKVAAGNQLDQVEPAILRFLERYIHADNTPEWIEAFYSSISEGEYGAPLVYSLASERGSFVGEDFDDVHTVPAQASTFAVQQFSLIDAAKIKPREFLFSRHYIRGYLSATVAPGGSGKSSNTMREMFSMALGRNLDTGATFAPIRALYCNFEDPLDEIQRRAAAIMKHDRIQHEDFGGRLFFSGGRTSKLCVVSSSKTGVEKSRADIDALRKVLTENKIDVAVLDPFVSVHRVGENDNGAMNAVVEVFRDLAEEARCSIELVHHVRKGAPGQGEFSVEDGRGAGAVLAGVRSARVINRMTAQEAAQAGVSDHRSYFRIDNGKSNMSPPGEKAVWRRMVSVDLENGTQDLPSDSVGVAVAWEWPDAKADVFPEDIDRICEKISNGAWRASVQANDWAGKAIAEVMGFDTNNPAERHRAKCILEGLIKDKTLRLVEKLDVSRKKKLFVEVAEGGAEW